MAGQPRYPAIRTNGLGWTVMAWFVYASGASGVGTVYYIFQQGAGATWSAPAQFVDSTATPLQIADGGWSGGGIDYVSGNQAAWEIAVIIDGASAPTVWQSYDSCSSWGKVGPP